MQGSFQKKGKKWYFVLRVGKIDPKTGQRKPKWFKGGDTKKEAQKACADFLAAYDPDTYSQPSKMKMNEYLDYWMENVVRVAQEPMTAVTYQYAVDKFKSFNEANLPLKKVNTILLQNFIKYLVDDGFKPATVELYIGAIKSALHSAVETDFLPHYPIKKLTLPEKQATEAQAYEYEQVLKILDALKGSKYERVILLIFATGLRAGEACGLREIDFVQDEKEPVLRIRQGVQYVPKVGLIIKEKLKTKTSKRDLPLGRNTVELLREQIHEQKKIKMRNRLVYQDHGLIFANEDGTPINPKNVSQSFAWYCEKIGVPLTKLHAMRHTFATMQLRSGECTINDLQMLLGHKKASTTVNVYTHSLPNDRRNAMANHDELIPFRKQS